MTSDAAVPVTIAANTSGYNRIDMIVIDVDDIANPIKALRGIPSSSPVAPTPTANQLPLALITVGNNASVINQNVITDIRTFVALLARSFESNNGGWSPLPAATYASTTSFTLPGDLHLLLERGTKIKVTQGSTDKYFYVKYDVTYFSGVTTVTVIGDSDVLLDASAIISAYFSKSDNPAGFPDWCYYLPTISATGSMTVSNVTISPARYKIVGRQLFIAVSVTVTTGGTADSKIILSLPVVATGAYAVLSGFVQDGSVAGYEAGFAYQSDVNNIRIGKTSNQNFTLGALRNVRVTGFVLL